MAAHVVLRVRLRRVAADAGDCMVRRAVVYRLHPDGRHWVEVRPCEDPQAEHEREVFATELAERAGVWTETGHAVWSNGPTWVESYVEGDRWTPIPRPTEEFEFEGLRSTDTGRKADLS